ncbi:MAG: PepSY-associated TM helix domain-containing protein [Vicinamibacteraceae bacterium]
MAQRIRTLFFWLHLTAGLLAGVVVLVMSATGVLLTFEKQVVYYADTRNITLTPPASAEAALPIDEVLARVRATGLVAEPSGVTVRRDPAAPVAVAVGQGTVAYVDPYTGRLLGRGDAGVRAFFRSVTDWHRWLAATGEYRTTGRAVTGASNLAFLFMVLSGAYLWIPRTWAWRAVKQVIWFRGGLPGKARDFNWHNTIGVWSVVPLAVVVASGVVISYPWASNLVYRIAGEAPPAPRGGGEGRPARAEGARTEGPGGERPRGERGRDGNERGEGRRAGVAGPEPPLAAAWATALAHRPEWRTITLRLPVAPTPTLAFTIDDGGPGQPQYRGTLTVDRASGAVAKWEGFDATTRGRQLRSLLRFAHTGEVLGVPGQFIAGLVSLGGVVLVYTGFALSYRRFIGWLARRRRPVVAAAARPAA